MPHSAAPLGPVRILHVEDSELDAELISMQLQEAGLEAEFLRVDSPAAMEQAMAEFQPDLVLSDLSMPGFSGQQALRIAVQAGGFDAVAWPGQRGQGGQRAGAAVGAQRDRPLGVGVDDDGQRGAGTVGTCVELAPAYRQAGTFAPARIGQPQRVFLQHQPAFRQRGKVAGAGQGGRQFAGEGRRGGGLRGGQQGHQDDIFHQNRLAFRPIL